MKSRKIGISTRFTKSAAVFKIYLLWEFCLRYFVILNPLLN